MIVGVLLKLFVKTVFGGVGCTYLCLTHIPRGCGRGGNPGPNGDDAREVAWAARCLGQREEVCRAMDLIVAINTSCVCVCVFVCLVMRVRAGWCVCVLAFP